MPPGKVRRAAGAPRNASPRFTVTEPIDVGAFTLPPGTYLIKVVMLESNRNMIQVTNEEQTKVFANVLATPHAIVANEAAPTSRYVYYPAAPGQRRALRTWFARDTMNGQDIVYPKRRATELAVVAKVPVPAIPDDVKETEYKSVSVTVVTPEQVKPYEEPAPPVMIAEARPPAQLPATSTRLPFSVVLGLLCVGGAIGARVLSKQAR